MNGMAGESLRGLGERRLYRRNSNRRNRNRLNRNRLDRLTTSYARNGRHFHPDDIDINHGVYKLTAAQKRQKQRDERRKRLHPNRTFEEERAERRRKDRQAENRGTPRGDPYHREFGDRDFAWNREVDREMDCYLYGRNCDYHALEYDNLDRRWDWDPLHDEY